MRFITASYSKDLALETAEYNRDLIRSAEFQKIYPDIGIKEDKDTKSNFRIVKRVPGLSASHLPKLLTGGSRYSTSVGSTLTGFHGDIIIIDDPLNPKQAASDVELKVATSWMDETVSSRKTDKAVTPTILIMQRLHQSDPSGHWLTKQKANIRHICLPGECRNYGAQVQPPEWSRFYQDDLLDPVRMPWEVLRDMEADLGQYGYAGQFGQNPTPPGGGMFKVDHFQFATRFPNKRVDHTVRYWDKAGTKGGGDYTVGLRMCRLENGFYVVEDVKRGQWGTNQREDIIKQTAEADGVGVEVWIETEPGSSGKESSENTIRNLAGFVVRQEHPTGDKVTRADPFSVQVNNGNVILMYGEWNKVYLDELRFFPFSTHKDQTDASSGCFNHLVSKRIARRIT
jgi:predicted phage terminase large subunit-like protein